MEAIINNYKGYDEIKCEYMYIIYTYIWQDFQILSLFISFSKKSQCNVTYIITTT